MPMCSAGESNKRWVITAVVLAWINPAFGQWREQNFQLEQGWNTVYLEVDPAEDDADALFGNQPPEDVIIERVWTWTPAAANGSGCLDPNDPDCELTHDSGWLVWLPPSDPARPVISLSKVTGGQVYLIKAGDQATLTVTGTPTTRKTRWLEGFNVAGFHVDETCQPTFASYLAPSHVHADPDIYVMDTFGDLSQVADPAVESIEPGRGYWVSAIGAAEYDGPLAINTSSRRGLLYGKHQVEHRLDLENLAGEGRTVTLTLSESADPPLLPPDLPGNAGVIPMMVRDYSVPDILYELIPFDHNNPVSVDVAAANPATPQDARKLLRLSVARQGQNEAVVTEDENSLQYPSILIITDGTGYRRRLPISAEVPGRAGLYVGTVSVDAVAWVQADAKIVFDPDEDNGYENPQWDCNRNGVADADDIAAGTSPDCGEPTNCFTQHPEPGCDFAPLEECVCNSDETCCSSDGQWHDGCVTLAEGCSLCDDQSAGNLIPDECEAPPDTTTPRPTQSPFTFPVIIHYDGDATYTFLRKVTFLFAPGDETTPGRYVLATPDCQNCDTLEAGTIIDGQPFKRQIATAAFSFEHDLTLSGNGFGGTLQGSTVVAADDRRNPIPHKLHPNQ